MVYMYTRKRRLTRAKRKETEWKKKAKRKDRKEKGNELRNKHALRAQARSPGDQAAVCCYDQSYDMSI